MSETAVGQETRLSPCRIVHLLVRLVLAMDVLIFATARSSTVLRYLRGTELATPLMSLAFVSSFVLPIIAIVEAVVVNHPSQKSRRGAVIDIAVTSLWAFAIIGLAFFGLTRYMTL